LTVSANCRSIEEAEGWFDTFEHTALPIFHAMGSELVPLNAVQRFQKIRNYFFTDDGEESFILPFQDMVQAGRFSQFNPSTFCAESQKLHGI